MIFCQKFSIITIFIDKFVFLSQNRKMICVGQIKAARGLLEWSQSDLAIASGLHVNAINNVERRNGHPRSDTIAQIQSAFEQEGIRFKGLTGVDLVQESLEIRKYSGSDFMRVLADDVLSVLTNAKHELIAVLPDEKYFARDSYDEKINNRYYDFQKKVGFRQRAILTKLDAISYMASEDVRYLSEEILGTQTYQVYGDKFVLINWESKELVFIRSASVAKSFRNQFEFFWQQAKPHPRRRK